MLKCVEGKAATNYKNGISMQGMSSDGDRDLGSDLQIMLMHAAVKCQLSGARAVK